MTDSLLSWARKIAPQFRNFWSFSKSDPSIKSIENSMQRISEKISQRIGKAPKSISHLSYENYFTVLKSLGLWEDFELQTSKDNITIRGSVVNSPIINRNNEKTVIFCHGVTSNKWSLFYTIHLVLQLGYRVVIYDARNHGLSQASYTTLGKIESLDLEDIVKWFIAKYKPSKIGFYGFSMGSATLLFWIGQFQDVHPQVSFVICEAPFDDFSTSFQGFLGLEGADVTPGWKHYFFHAAAMKMLSSPFDISEISPISCLPNKLKVKLLLLHGLGDTVISWKSSRNIWQKLSQEPANNGMVNLYLFDYADHGEVPFFGDFSPGNLHWIKEKEKVSKFSFSSLLFNFLGNNF